MKTPQVGLFNQWLRHYNTVFGFRPISYFMQAFAKLNCNKYNKELGVQLKVQSFLELTATNDPVLLYNINLLVHPTNESARLKVYPSYNAGSRGTDIPALQGQREGCGNDGCQD